MSLSTLRARFGGRLRQHVPLASYTTLRIGGPAEYLLEAHTTEELITACRACLEAQIPFYLFAGCSNLLISDRGLAGLVLINKTDSIAWHEDFTVAAAGGYNLDRLVSETCERGWSDLTFAAGIPGSLGGALIGGAGAFGHLVCEYLRAADILRKDGTVAAVSRDGLGIGYRTSEAKKRGDIILTAVMGPFTPGAKDALREEADRIRAEREIKHPGPKLPSAGSFFKNLPPLEPGGHRIPAGKYLEEAGAKKLRVGDAGVFEKHANIIVNHGNATAEQVNRLADLMAERVKEKFGILLEREVQYLC
ncbi:MAG: UDP-N-acetylmuramate dehydrogenase [bacterium]